MRKMPEYSIWKQMIYRCTKPSDKFYHRYGGRGISVCESWLNSFQNFISDMGERPSGHELDRINNDMGYFKENCRWATRKQQIMNRCLKKTKYPRGVIQRNKAKKIYSSNIKINGSLIYIGSYKEEHHAHLAYLVVFKEWYGHYPLYLEIDEQVKVELSKPVAEIINRKKQCRRGHDICHGNTAKNGKYFKCKKCIEIWQQNRRKKLFGGGKNE